MRNNTHNTVLGRITLCLLLTVAGTMFSSCAATDGAKVYIRDGREYGVVTGAFRHRWWNYYERGESYLSGGYNDESVRDLLTAIGQRGEDQRRARTYGMHFLDYFPHRELGVAYLGMGRVEDAVRELETSLSQEESARAKFYLNRARAEMLRAAGTVVPPPTITIDTATPKLTNAPYVVLSGAAESDAYVSGLSVGGRPEYIELAGKSVTFTKEVRLVEGENVIEVTSADLLGNESAARVTIVSDTRGPTVTVDDTGGDVRAYANDPSGISAMRLNGREVQFRTEGSEAVFELGLTERATINIEAVDAAGNSTTAQLGLGGPAGTPDEGVWYDFPTSWYGPDDGYGYEPVASGGQKTQVAARKGPVIKLKGLTDSQEVYFDSLYVEGYAAGRSKVTGVYINGEPVNARDGNKVFFGFLVPLKVGQNVIELEAEDEDGNATMRSVKVVRLESSVHSVSERLSVSAVPFDTGGLSGMAYDSFMDSLVGMGRFRVVERALIEEILMEQELSQSQLADPSTAARLGRLAAAEAVIVGGYTETEDSIEIYCRLVDTETSEVIVAHDVYGEEKGLMAVADLMEGLAVKFRNSFPRVEGIVMKAEGDDLTVDIGDSQGIGKNFLFVLFREGEEITHPATGKKLGAPTEVLGKARLKTAYDDFSNCTVVDRKPGAKIAALDGVMTR